MSARALFAQILGSAAAVMIVAAHPATARAGDNLVTLYSFCAQKPNCTDGSTSYGPMLRDAGGDMFGTTTAGGTNSGGTLFEIPAGGSATVLYSFCSLQDCADGAQPYSNLIEDKNGNLYGVTQYGGTSINNDSSGVVFELTPNRQHTQWTLSVLYNFCSQTNCADGQTPYAGLAYAGQKSGKSYNGNAPLYGTTASGGGTNSGVAFALSAKHGGPWQETVLYSFCSRQNCTDGQQPSSALLVGKKGKIYGVTAGGGNANGDGAFYELSSKKKKYLETVLYAFCQKSGCVDGLGPGGALAMDASGAIYGTTAVGGSENSGAIYKLVPDGKKSVESVLYSFCPGGQSCADGRFPNGVTLDANGNLFGTTPLGGQTGFGVAYELQAGQQSVLYTFCQ